jgi:lysophospholipase L1-like esterase
MKTRMGKPISISTITVLALVLMLVLGTVLISGCAPQPVWSYVALGDDNAAPIGVGDDSYVEYFAEYLREDLGVDLEVHNYGKSHGPAGRLLDLLRTDSEMRQAIADANVITIWIGDNDIFTLHDRFVYESFELEDNLDYIRKKVGQINDNIDGILDEILALNPSEETRIMIAENVLSYYYYLPWKEHGCFDGLQKEIYGALQEHLIKAASERGIIVVHTYQIINGPLGDRDIEELYQLNGWIFNKEGHRLIADAHREAWE